jgi:large subunit ribosomal protein L30
VTTVRFTQTWGGIGETAKHRGTLRSLGLGKIGRSAEHSVSPALEGKLRRVAHLVTVTPLDGKGA